MPKSVIIRAQSLQELWQTLHPRARVRWVNPKQFHLTLKFLGETSTELESALIQTLPGYLAPFSAFDLTTSALDYFPHPRRPRVMVWGLETQMRLLALAEAVESCCRELGFQPENRPFRPHITLGRIKQAPLTLQPIETLVVQWPCSELILFGSQLTPQGAIYQQRHCFAVGGADREGE